MSTFERSTMDKKLTPKKKQIVEKELGIPADYQYKALRTSNFLQANWHSNKLVALEYVLNFNKKLRVLDVGSGSGNFELIFGKRFKSIDALDYHKEALSFLKSKADELKLKNIRYIHSDIQSMPASKKIGTYDLILMVDVIEHIKMKEAKEMIAFYKKILAPNGKICIITPNYHSLWIYIEEILDKFTIVPHFAGHQHLAQYYPENLQKIFRTKGFRTVRTASFNTFSFLMPFRLLSTFFTKLEISSNIKFGNLLMGVFEHEKK